MPFIQKLLLSLFLYGFTVFCFIVPEGHSNPNPRTGIAVGIFLGTMIFFMPPPPVCRKRK